MRTLLFKKTKPSVIPGFGLTMGFTFLYMAVLVIVPLSMVFFHTMSMGPGDVWHIISEPRAAASYRLSFLTAGLRRFDQCGFRRCHRLGADEI